MCAKKFFIVCLLSAIACFPSLLFAQGPGFELDPDALSEVPIDGGLSLLLAASVGFGAKKVSDRKRKTNNQ